MTQQPPIHVGHVCDTTDQGQICLRRFLILTFNSVPPHVANFQFACLALVPHQFRLSLEIFLAKVLLPTASESAAIPSWVVASLQRFPPKVELFVEFFAVRCSLLQEFRGSPQLIGQSRHDRNTRRRELRANYYDDYD